MLKIYNSIFNFKGFADVRKEKIQVPVGSTNVYISKGHARKEKIAHSYLVPAVFFYEDTPYWELPNTAIQISLEWMAQKLPKKHSVLTFITRWSTEGYLTDRQKRVFQEEGRKLFKKFLPHILQNQYIIYWPLPGKLIKTNSEFEVVDGNSIVLAGQLKGVTEVNLSGTLYYTKQVGNDLIILAELPYQIADELQIPIQCKLVNGEYANFSLEFTWDNGDSELTVVQN